MQAVVEGTAARRVRGARELVGLPVRPGGGRPADRRQVVAAVHGAMPSQWQSPKTSHHKLTIPIVLTKVSKARLAGLEQSEMTSTVLLAGSAS